MTSGTAFYRVKLNPVGQVDFDAADDDEAVRTMAQRWTQQDVAVLLHLTGPAQARAQRRVWPPPP